MADAQAIDPIHQFYIERFKELHVGSLDLTFTKASLFMIIVVLAVTGLMVLATSARAIVPGRLQAAAESCYDFIASTVRSVMGEEGMLFFPFVFSLFMFILFANIIGLLPTTLSVTSQIAVTFAFALVVIMIVILYGIYKNGAGFLKLFVPHGMPFAILFVLVPIEIISFLSRPISLSVRLFANILAGHITLAVFGGFVVMLLGAGAWAILAPIPLAAIVVLYALELLVACLQAFVFAILTCVYLKDALHPGH